MKLEKTRRRGRFDMLGTDFPSDPVGSFYIVEWLPGRFSALVSVISGASSSGHQETKALSANHHRCISGRGARSVRPHVDIDRHWTLILSAARPSPNNFLA